MTVKESAPTVSDWKALYRAALDFKEIEAWTWMYDTDVFGVQDPATGEIGYCCVMGAAGEMFALAVYLGTEGLESYMRIAAGPPADPLNALEQGLLQKCLMVYFADREELAKEDHQVIKRLGLKFRGRNAWPLFRSYRPAYHPWYLTADEARFLTLALQQAREVCLRVEEAPELFDPPEEDLWFVRVPEKAEKGSSWRDAWLEPAPLEWEEPEAAEVDEVRLARIRKHRRTSAIWEMDIFLSPEAVQEKRGERPFYPYMMMTVDHVSYLILDTGLASPEPHRTELLERFLSLLDRLKWLPAEIWIKREEVGDLLEPATSRLGIELYTVDELEALDEARAALGRFMGL